MTEPLSIRAVLDTNVLVSGLLSPAGVPGDILNLAINGQVGVVFSAAILAEYAEVLVRTKFGFRAEVIQRLLSQIDRTGLLTIPFPWPHQLPDPDDEPFLAAAAAGHCPLVTGNVRHYPARMRSGVMVLKPREFLDMLRQR